MLRGSDRNGAIGLFRGERTAPFSGSEQRLLDRLSVHLGQSMKIASQLGVAADRSGLLKVVLHSTAEEYVILVHGDGRVHFCTHAAELLLTSGCVLHNRRNYLTLDFDPHATLQKAITLASPWPEGGYQTTRVDILPRCSLGYLGCTDLG